MIQTTDSQRPRPSPSYAASAMLLMSARLRRSMLILPLLGMLLPGLVAAADVRAYFDRPRVYEGDTVTLTIEVAGVGNRSAPDLSPLAADFEVGGTSVGSEISIINGQRSDLTRYSVALSPKHTGTLQVPALRLGAVLTAPLTLTVEPVPAGGLGGPGDQLFLEVAIDGDPKALMVNQQVPLVVRAYSAATLYDYELRLPTIDGAVLTRLGRETARMTQRNGEPYRVVEWRFSLSPERSGELRIGPLVFAARVEDPTGAAPADPMARMFRDPMFDRMFGSGGLPGRLGFDRGRPARAQSAPMTLEVAAAPAGFAGTWLPATEVTISDDWSGSPPRLAVGEPTTRTFTIRAAGLTGNQLPDVELPLPAGVRGYPGRTETSTESDGAGVYGISHQQVTIIPQQGGTLVLPEVRIPWWDTAAKVRREAVLPALRVEVAGPVAAPTPAPAGAGAAATSADQSAAPSASQPAAAAPAPTPAGQTGAPGASGATGATGAAWWTWALGGLALLAAGFGLWRWWAGRGVGGAEPRVAPGQSRPAAPRRPAAPDGSRAEAARERLRLACAASDASAAAQALLAWAAASLPSPPPVNLSALAAQVGSGGELIRALERQIYARAAGPWDGAALWAAVQHGLQPPAPGGDAAGDALAPLYPSRG